MPHIDRFIVQAFVRDTDDKGRPALIRTEQGEIVHEVPQPVVTVLGADGLRKYVRDLEKKLRDG